MKITIKPSKITLSALTLDEANAIIRIVSTANERCFREPESGWDDKQENGDYYSGDDFICVLSGNQRKALDGFCKSLNLQLEMLNKSNGCSDS